MLATLARHVASANARKPNRAYFKMTRFSIIPYDIFRIQHGPLVRLRDYDTQQSLGRRSFDVRIHDDGLIHPMVGDVFTSPNGCSVRPMGAAVQDMVDTFQSANTIIFRIPQGVPLPPTLTLIHERSDHHALQCTEPMTLHDLNASLTKLLQQFGEIVSVNEFWDRYPIAAE